MSTEAADKKSSMLYLVQGKNSPLGFMFAGGVSGAVSRTCAAPFERLKILYQVSIL